MTRERLIMAFGVLTAAAAVTAVGVNLFLAKQVFMVPEGEGPDAPAEQTEGAPVVSSTGGSAAVASSSRRSEKAYLDAIMGRNIFDHENVGVTASTDGEGAGVAVTDLKVTLTGTMVAEPASFSAAFIIKEGEDSFYAYGIGQKIMDAEVVEILKDRVRLKRADGAEEWLVVGSEEAPTTRSTASAGGEEGEVEKVSDTEFVVSRDMLDAQLNDLSGLSKMGRALLHRGPDGEYDGYRLSAIRRGTLADKLGIRNGDVVHSVNGMELNSVQGAMQALQALQSEDALKFEVTRRGQRMTLSYDIQ